MQHDIQFIHPNQMLLFNNNDVSKGNVSSIEIIELPNKKNNKIKSLYSLKLNVDSISDGKALRMGSVEILPNTNFLINEGSASRIIEVNKKNEIVWDMIIEKVGLNGIKKSKFALYKVDYSSSLYPYYFNFYFTDKNNIILFNGGSNIDDYSVIISDENQNILYNQKTTLVQNGESKKIPIRQFKDKKIEVKIKSLKSNIVKTKHLY